MIRYRKHLAIALVAAALCAPAGCARQTMETPAGFVALEPAGWLYADRAVSPDGVYVGVRASVPAEGGDLSFWNAAIRNHLTGARGYAPAGEADLASADGVAGRRMDFTVTADQRELAYTLGVWVHGDRVTVAEAGGPKAACEAARARIDAALASVTVK
jgi:hypothetical protein